MNDQNYQSRNHYDWSGTAPSAGVVESVSDALGVDPDDLDPLYRSVDPDALNALFDPSRRPSDGLSVTLEYADHEVAVHADGTVLVRALAQG